ncbi:MAG: class I SAM-dependent methyltransferase [Chloroflexi bacterium]|nr:class I SAM-dependent methyltransferase [Chloroflexota bacterium]
MNVTKVYSFWAPLYDRVRAVWARGIMGRAEAYLEREVLPLLVTPETRILDLGSGTGVNLSRLRRLKLSFASYVGLDLTPAMLAQAQTKQGGDPGTDFLQGDIWRLPFAARSFDLVISTWALSHLWPTHTIFDEIDRVLDPAGVMFALYWSRPAWPMSQIAQLVERIFDMRFVERAELEHRLGGRAVTRSFAAGWGASIEFKPGS